MRIIGGIFKGKKILEPFDNETRPLKDLTKESIFNILNHSNKFKVEIKDSIILDLFSICEISSKVGTGGIGVEFIDGLSVTIFSKSIGSGSSNLICLILGRDRITDTSCSCCAERNFNAENLSLRFASLSSCGCEKDTTHKIKERIDE